MNLTIENLTLSFKGEKAPLLHDVNITVHGGDFIALVGRNGAGKSTLLKCLAGLRKPTAGELWLEGQPLSTLKNSQRAKLVSFVSTETINVAHLRVWDVVAMGRSIYSSWNGQLSQEDHQIITQALESVGMHDFAQVPLTRLSDGERGRIMIARALAQQTPLILLDEPTAFLDLPNRYMIVRLLRQLAHQFKKIVILSTHELNLALELADRLWIVSDGNVTDGTVEQTKDCDPLRKMFETTNIL